MAGIPLTAGFIGKFGLFSQAIQTAPFIVLIAVLGSAISIAYYLRLIIAMYFFKDQPFETAEKASLTYNIVAVAIIVIIVAIGVYPDFFSLQFHL